MLAEKNPAVTAGLLVALLMVAGQVAGKATRDALFLTNFAVTSLPVMMVLAAAVSLGAVLLASRIMALYGPNRIIPLAFGASGLALVGEWYLLSSAPQSAAVLVYFHETVVGAILISGFWSIVNESFEPQAAKKCIAYFGCAGTAGGLAGCVLAQWIATEFSVASMLPLLAAMHILCAWFVRGLKTAPSERLKERDRNAAIAAESRAFGSAFRILRRTSYARDLALLIMLAASTAVLVNYTFKARAASVYQGEDLLRFFASFYMVASLLTFVVQSTLSRFFLERLGGARTVAALPVAVGASAVFGVLFPGLTSAVFVGGVDSVLRNSIFRTGYESLYVPVSRRVKRSTKSIIDVGFDRIGNVVGGGTIQLLILLGSGATGNLILVFAVLVSMLAIMVAIRLRHGYIDALEKRLLRHSGSQESAGESPERVSILDPGEISKRFNPLEYIVAERGFVLTKVKAEDPPAIFSPTPLGEDSVRGQFAQLRSGQADEVKAVLSGLNLNLVLAPQVVQLLAWEEVSAEAVEALQRIAPGITGLLTDALLDEANHPRIRSLVPRILGSAPSERALEALFRGLKDPVFDIRFQCGRALGKIRNEHPDIKILPDIAYEALRAELGGNGFPGGPQDLLEKPEDSYLTEGISLDQVNWRLEHIFTILSLVVARDPLRIAFRGLHSMEETVRGTAVEYLSSLLPGQIRSTLLPIVERIARQS